MLTKLYKFNSNRSIAKSRKQVFSRSKFTCEAMLLLFALITMNVGGYWLILTFL